MNVRMIINPQEIRSVVENEVQKKVRKLQRRLVRFPAENVFLEVKIEEEHPHKTYMSQLNLSIPHKKFVTKSTDSRPELAASKSFESLLKVVERYKISLSRKIFKKPQVKIPETTPRETKSLLENVLRKSAGKLYEFAKNEVVDLQLRGIINPGEIDPIEVVNEAIVSSIDEWKNITSNQDMEKVLFKAIMHSLEKFVNEVKRESNHKLYIEEPLNAIQEEELLSRIGDEVFSSDSFGEYWEPDESLRLEDIIPDPNSVTPEFIIDSEDFQKLLRQSLSKLPEPERRAFQLIVVSGVDQKTASYVLNMDVKKVEAAVESATRKLTAILSNENIKPTISQLKRWYAALSETSTATDIDVYLKDLLG